MRRLLLMVVALLLVSSAAFAGGPPAAGPQERIWPDETIYFVFLDRFHNGDQSNDAGASTANPRGWHGGDLQGVIEKLDYIKSMGFTAIWITPHVKNAGNDYHGYGAVDFFQTDPHFGTVEKTKELVDKAHAKGIKVIFDIVVNHTGPRHPLVYEKPEWFNPKKGITNWNDARELQLGWIFDLPDFDQTKPEVREYILSYSKFWIEKTGVDGFRLDTVRHVPPEFFTWYAAELRRIKPGFWLIGEVWEGHPFKLSVYQDAGVTAMLDFPDSEVARKVFAKGESMSRLASMAGQVSTAMTDPWAMGAFLDNHDMERFVSHAGADAVPKLKLGLVWLFTQRSIPILYYGTEIAMPGGNDPFNRDDFPWGQEQNTDVRDLVTKLNAIRKAHPALRRGELKDLASDQYRWSYARQSGQDTVVVVLNNHGGQGYTEAIDLSRLSLPEGTILTDALTGRQVKVEAGRAQVAVGARSGAIYTTAVPFYRRPVLWAWVGAAGILGALGLLWYARKKRS